MGARISKLYIERPPLCAARFFMHSLLRFRESNKSKRERERERERFFFVVFFFFFVLFFFFFFPTLSSQTKRFFYVAMNEPPLYIFKTNRGVADTVEIGTTAETKEGFYKLTFQSYVYFY